MRVFARFWEGFVNGYLGKKMIEEKGKLGRDRKRQRKGSLPRHECEG